MLSSEFKVQTLVEFMFLNRKTISAIHAYEFFFIHLENKHEFQLDDALIFNKN